MEELHKIWINSLDSEPSVRPEVIEMLVKHLTDNNFKNTETHLWTMCGTYVNQLDATTPNTKAVIEDELKRTAEDNLILSARLQDLYFHDIQELFERELPIDDDKIKMLYDFAIKTAIKGGFLAEASNLMRYKILAIGGSINNKQDYCTYLDATMDVLFHNPSDIERHLIPENLFPSSFGSMLGSGIEDKIEKLLEKHEIHKLSSKIIKSDSENANNEEINIESEYTKERVLVKKKTISISYTI